ncbi:DNA-3-methyladenine glycosylase 2 family protein [Nakamurella flavida]|uniref:DNA-3-methyladenine glycosylase II n=1 Tax=Nakamurella flavida TaxID=363630 RepID=A0A938YLN8_9ACTN|nr:DNA-3-methyladenine glycosylase 2 family protein [Nakamurella flavida]MBM9475692.1 DNA-3-methyladenine glycosylase 2 family protein [Nakamurella flavida]MDP9778031.1 3-methyladenine DNA glycosylase/8-oxoguanine DNA glycosylase [Nakamurella flavida]
MIAPVPEAAPGQLGWTTVDLPVHPPFPLAPAVTFLAGHALPGLETVLTDERGVTRVERLLPVEGELVQLRLTLGPDAVHLEHTAPPGEAARRTVAEVHRWLNLDLEPARLLADLGRDPTIGDLIRARPGLRMIGHPDGYEAAVMTVLGQQVSVAACRTFGTRLARAFGSAHPSGLWAFPAAGVLAGITAQDLQAEVRITNARARTVLAVATACADGLRIDAEGDHGEIRRHLLALPGVGPWTVDYLAVRALGDRNAFPVGDLVLRRAMGVDTPAQASVMGRAWEPWRAYALIHLWGRALGL